MKDKIIEILKKLGLYSEEKQGEIEKVLTELKIDEGSKPDPPKAKNDPSPEVRELITALQGQVKALSDALAEETKLRKQQADAVAAQIKKEREAKIDAALKKAKDEGKITPAQEAHYRKLLEGDYDTTVAIIEALPVNPASKKGDDKKPDSKPVMMRFEQTGNKAIVDKIKELAQVSEN